MAFNDFLRNSRKYSKKYEETVEQAVAKQRRLIDPPFYINKLNHSIPEETRRWIRNAADERAAVEHGCFFNEASGQYVVDWIESHCVLYEGDNAGDLMSVEDWQYEMYMQSFSWMWFDEEWEARRSGAGWVRRYKVISGWIPKKNCKSPTLASTGLYCLMADGEWGQKCFSLATTRDQALISHTHALNFISQSPRLAARCKINATEGSIYDKETKSSYSILCGDKGTNKKSKEGINGSLFIDETHVVDRAFMGVINRAGISRRQPLRMQLSTAGENTDGYGYDEYSFGKDNLIAANEGRSFDFRYYHFDYGIPQETSVDDLRDSGKIDAFIRVANPTIGRVIRFQEAKEDWQRSCRSDTELIQFAMYRLNQWNTGGGAFVAGSDWDRCYSPFKIDMLKEHPCVIGADLSKISDMTSLVLAFAVPKEIEIPIDWYDVEVGMQTVEVNIPHIIPFFWLPKRSLAQYHNRLNVEDLRQRKQLFVTESPIVKIEIIAEHINHLAEQFDFRGLACDMYRSKKLAATLISKYDWNEETDIFLIPQNAQTQEPAIEQLQGCILSKEIVHGKHPVMDWQLKNIVVTEDTQHNRKFTKPGKNDYRKIDGWQSLLNAFCLLMNDPDLYPGSSSGISLISEEKRERTS